jgi:uncharacterized protein YwqG
MPANLILPKALAPYEAKFLKTQKPSVRIIPDEGMLPLPWQSKLGGTPYMELDAAFPLNAQGIQLCFLAQLNFAEIPPIEGFPSEGLLQFYIFDDGLYGLNEEEPERQDNFRILFIEKPLQDESKLVRNFGFLRTYGDLPIIAERSFGLRFEAQLRLMPESDYRFDGIFGEDFFERFGAEEWNVAEAYHIPSDAAGHHIGGYAECTQEDPRTEENPMELLFQLDSDRKYGIQWGELGVCHFFIRPEDLSQRDFSRVLYHWDCY